MTVDKTPSGREVTLDQFITELTKDVQEFAQYWKQGMENPTKFGLAEEEKFPSEYPLGDWWEQFMAFISLEDRT